MQAQPDPPLPVSPENPAFRRLMRYAWPYRWHLGIALLFSVGVAAMTATTAWLIDPVLKYIFKEEDQSLLVVLPLAFVVVSFVKGGCRYGHAVFMGYVGNHVMNDLRNLVYRHAIRLPIDRFNETTTGGLLSRIISDVSMMQEAASVVVKELVQNSLTLAFLTVVVFMKDPVLGPFALLVLPLAAFPMVKIGRRLRKISKAGQVEMSRIADQLQESLTGVRVVKTFAQEGAECDRFEARTEDYLSTRLRAVRVSELSAPLMETLSSLGLALVIGIGGYRVFNKYITFEELSALLVAIGMMYAPLKALSKVSNKFQRAMGAAERVFEVIDWPTESERDRGTDDSAPLEHSLVIEDVSFRYPGEKISSLDHVSLRIERGEAVALVGRSGSGKSTLAALLMRFYDPTEGRLLWDGTPLPEFRLAAHRREIGYVSQDVTLFDGSIRENILYGQADAGEEALMQAAEAANALTFIQELPRGFDTAVGEKGVRLSGGQKQRIAIARTLLSNPSVLILDEATSALDSEAEALVQEAIGRLMVGRTTLMIAHRLTSIRNADRIVVLDQGRIVEQGRRDVLMERDGPFRRLARLGDATA